jgi:hypothetical protein
VSFFTPVYTVQDGSELEVYPEFAVEYRDVSHRYWIHAEGARVPAVSVTSVLKVLNKPQLLKWAESRGAEGAARLAAMGELKDVAPEDAGDLVRLHKLGADAKRDAGGEGGTATHSVLEHWGRYEEIPNLADYQPEVRGFVQGLCGWLLKRAPKPTSTERIVGSAKHTYAGRLDMRAVIDGKDTLVDLKRKRVYTEAHLQTRGYALADVECGNPPPDDILIVAVAGDGSFQEARCEASEADWLSVLATQRAMLRLDKLARAA